LTAYTSHHKDWSYKAPRDADSRLSITKALDGNKTLFLENDKQQLSDCFSFEQKRNEPEANRHFGNVVWSLILRARTTKIINYV